MKIRRILQEIKNEYIFVEALKPSEFRNLMKIGRNAANQRIDQIWNRLKGQSVSQNRNGDRLFFNLAANSDDSDTGTQTNNEIQNYLSDAGYDVVNFKDGMVRKTNDKNITKMGKILTMLGKQDQNALKLLQKYNNEKSNMISGNDYIMVISRSAYDIGGASTDRSWTSCMNLRAGDYAEYIPIDIEQGTLISYLVNKSDKNIQKPIARILVKPYINVEDESDVLYGIESDKVKYGRQHEGYVKTLMQLLDKAQGEKSGIFKLDAKVYRDIYKQDVNSYDDTKKVGNYSTQLQNFKLKFKELEDGLSIEDVMKKFPWLLTCDFESAIIGETYDKHLEWYSGTWKNGTWKDGTWHGGIWKTGKWEYGTWENGTWEDGEWKDGTWENGTWENGTWEDGEWENGTWKNGTWKDGLFKDGTWRGGTWEAGEFRYGTWLTGIWKNGTWRGGTWKDGEWKDGTWVIGTWEDGEWKSDKPQPKTK